MTAKTKRVRGQSGLLTSGDGGDGAFAFRQMLSAGFAKHRAGDLAGAEQIYQQIVTMQPNNADALNLLGVCAFQAGRAEEAVELIGRAISHYDLDANFFVNRGAALQGLGRHKEAAKDFAHGLELNPDSVEAHANLAVLYKDQGKTSEAVKSYNAAIGLGPGSSKLHKQLGGLYLEHDQFEEAEVSFRAYLQDEPDDAEVSNNLGFALEKQDKFAEAEPFYRRAAELRPDVGEIVSNAGNALRHLGRFEDAHAHIARAVALEPDRWDFRANLATVLRQMGRHDEAIAQYRRIVEDSPENPVMQNDLGISLFSNGRYRESLGCFAVALDLQPDYPDAHNNIGNAHLALGDFPAAEAAFRDALKHRPRFFQAHVNLCQVLKLQHKLDQANLYGRAALLLEEFTPVAAGSLIQVFRTACDYEGLAELGNIWQVVEQLSGDDLAATFLSLLAEADDAQSTARLVALHKKFGADATASAARAPLAPAPLRVANPKIRVGFLSSDLRQHSVAKFLMPFFMRYDRDRFDVLCYSALPESDDPVQQEIKRQVEDFVVVHDMSDHDVAARIRNDAIDVLIDLNGLTQFSRVKVLAYRPAPVQITYLGYPFTTGVDAVDYVVVDPLTAPVEDGFFVEKNLILPGAWACFEEFPDYPIAPPPLVENGHVTFGTLNNPYKFSPALFELWSAVLNRVTDSRFVMVRPECASAMFQNNVRAEFAKHGVAAERLTFIDNYAGKAAHFEYYNLIDIALDTYPVTGGTTTCESLWMGVPTVSRIGPSYHQRISYAVLSHSGLGELCAETNDDYVTRAVELAANPARLEEMRLTLREKVRASPLCDAPSFVDNFQQAIADSVSYSRNG